MIPGEFLFDGPDLEVNAGRATVNLKVKNTATGRSRSGRIFISSRPIPPLVFDRQKAYGMRLDLLSGTADSLRAGRSERRPAHPLRRRAQGLRHSTAWSWASSTIRPCARSPSSD